MDAESKLHTVADLSDQTNNMSVINADAVPLSKPIGKKTDSKELEEVEDDDRERKRRRKDSKDRDSRRSHRDRSSSKGRDEGRRHRDGDRDRDRERDKARDKPKDGVTEKEKDKKDSKEEDKDKTRDKDKERERDRAREKERERDRDGRRDKDRERDRDRDRERDRDRDRERGRGARDRDSRDRGDRRRRRSNSRSRSPPRRRGESGRDSRRRSRSPSSDADRRKSHRRSSSKDKDKSSSSAKGEGESQYKQITLRDIIAANPGISVPEAVVRLNAYNTAVARGLVPDPITGPPQIPGLTSAAGSGMMPGMGMGVMPMNALNAANALGSLGVLGDGGAATKPHRELYVGNLPPGITVPQLAEFINTAFKQLGLSKDPTVNTVVTAWVSPDGHYAFVEMRTVEEATAALTYLNGIQVGVFSLKIGRPKGYAGGGASMGSALAVPMQGTLPMAMPMGMGANPLLSAATGMLGSVPGLGVSNPLLAGLSSSMGGTDALSHVIMVTNLPSLISETQIKELFTPFGALKAFNVIKAGQTQSAVFEYVDSALTDGVVGGMNGLEIADHKLSVQRIPASSAAVLLQPSLAPPPPATAAPLPAAPAVPLPAPTEPDELASQPPSTVIRMSNMTTPQDLADDTQYEELLEDVADECNTHGTVKSLVIPRGLHGETDSSVGKIFVHFVDIAGAQRSLKAVAGRKFNGRLVEAYFYPEELFTRKIYTLPKNGASATQNGHQQQVQHKMTDDINDIDEGEAPTVSVAVHDAYDPTENLEDLD